MADHDGVRHWPSAIDGLRATETDLLVEVTANPSTDGEPGLAHMREALRRGIAVVTSNKSPVKRWTRPPVLNQAHRVQAQNSLVHRTRRRQLSAVTLLISGVAHVIDQGLVWFCSTGWCPSL